MRTMFRSWQAAFIVLALATFAGPASGQTSAQPRLANPASQNCISKGGQHVQIVIRRDQRLRRHLKGRRIARVVVNAALVPQLRCGKRHLMRV